MVTNGQRAPGKRGHAAAAFTRWPALLPQSRSHHPRASAAATIPTAHVPASVLTTINRAFMTTNSGYKYPARESESRSVVSDSLPPQGLCRPWNSPGQNTGVGSRSLLQGIFPTQGSNPGLPHCGRILYQLSYRGSILRYPSK